MEEAVFKRLAKRAAFHATVAIGELQRQTGRRFPRYASFWRRAAGYVAYAMAGEAIGSDSGGSTVAPQSPTRGCGSISTSAPRILVTERCTIAIEEPIDIVDAGFFHCRGWLTETPIAHLNASVNGRTFRCATYPRPDVQRAYPASCTTGFSSFIPLGEVPDAQTLTIRLKAGLDVLIEHTVAATAAAVEAGRRDAEARLEKREWLLGRLLCVACGGALNEHAACRSCGQSYADAGFLNCLPLEGPWLSDIEFNGAVCSHGYDSDVERVIARADAAGGKVLDCGAGLRPVSRRNVVTTDIFPYPTTDVLAINERLPFKEGSFDAVLSLHVLEHVADPFLCARELYRVLKPGGTLFAVTPMIVPEHGFPHHFFNPTREGLPRLFGRTRETARVFVPAMGHPINGLWSTLALYRDSLPPTERERFLALSVRSLLERSIDDWITDDLATSLTEEGQMRLAANFCIEFVK
jgi:SAM-dependent methyltransferase